MSLRRPLFLKFLFKTTDPGIGKDLVFQLGIRKLSDLSVFYCFWLKILSILSFVSRKSVFALYKLSAVNGLSLQLLKMSDRSIFAGLNDLKQDLKCFKVYLNSFVWQPMYILSEMDSRSSEVTILMKSAWVVRLSKKSM